MGSTCRLCGATVEDQKYCSSCHRPLAANPESLLSQTIGSHQLQRFIGEGPIGMVFEALHTPSGASVRLKLIDSEIPSKEPSLIDEANQAIVGSTGLHDSLPELMEVSLDQPDARLVSVQWIDGQTLRERLAGGPLTEVDACLIIGAVLHALDALHSAGLTHRDLKPENILIAPEGSDPAVHLLDVGPSVISAKARSGAHYRSPEQARGGELIGPDTDIYACGALLYEALSGRRPFESSDYDVLMSQISLRRPPPLGQHCPHLSPGLLQVISKAMEPTPVNRYPSAIEMLRALRAFVSEQERPSLPERRLPIPQPAVPAAVVAAQDAGTAQPAPPPGSMLAREDLPPPPAAAQAQGEAFHFETGQEPFSFEAEVEPPTIRRPDLVDDAAVAPRQGSSGMKIAAIIFVVVALVAGGGLVYYALMEREEVEALDQEAASNAAPTPTPTPTPSESRGTVSVKLNGLPRGAIFYVDGHRLGSNPFRAPRSAAVHKIRVEAPNHEPFETEVSFGDDQEIAVEMTATEPPETPGQIKAHTKGLRANQRSWKRGPIRLSVKRTKSGPDASKAPDQLRDRDDTAPR